MAGVVLFLWAAAAGLDRGGCRGGARCERKRKWVLVDCAGRMGSGDGANEIERRPAAGRVDEMVHKKHKKSAGASMRWGI